MQNTGTSTSGQYSRRKFLTSVGAGAGLAAAAALGLDACGGSSSSSAAGASLLKKAGSSKDTLSIAIDGDQAAATALAKTVGASFEKANPGVKLDFMAINATDWNDFFAKILTLIAAGTPPDLTSIATEGLNLFAGTGLAEPLDSYVLADKANLKSFFADVNPVLIESMMYQGSLFVLPTSWNAGNMFYDTTLFEQQGIERPADDWTQSDFEVIANKFAKTSNAVAWDWVVRLWGSWTSWMYANDANILTEERWPGGSWMWDTFYNGEATAAGRQGGWRWGAPTANDPAVVEALQYMIDLKQANLSATPDTGGGGTLQGLFASNHIAMTIGGGFWAGGLSAAGMKPTQFDVQYFPKWKVQKPLLGTAGYALFKHSEKKELAWEFLKTLVTPEAVAAQVAGNTSSPVLRSLATASAFTTTGPTHWQVFYDTVDNFPNTTNIPAPTYYQSLANAFNTRTTQAMASGNAKSALDGFQSDLEGFASSKSASGV